MKKQMPHVTYVGVVKDMDHLLQCELYAHQQLRLRNQLNAIMNRNDEARLLKLKQKAEVRTAARTARHRRPDIDAFKCMKHIIEETNRYNISAVGAALHSYVRMIIEKYLITSLHPSHICSRSYISICLC